MNRRPAPENLSGLINQLMRQQQLTVLEVRRRLGRKYDPVHVHGAGHFECDCTEQVRTWNSAFSWISVDLADQVVAKRWRMKCKLCRARLEPEFELEELERMVTEAIRLWAIRKKQTINARVHRICFARCIRVKSVYLQNSSWIMFKGERRPFIHFSRPRNARTPPHLEALCEKCVWGRGIKCWTAPPWRPPPMPLAAAPAPHIPNPPRRTTPVQHTPSQGHNPQSVEKLPAQTSPTPHPNEDNSGTDKEDNSEGGTDGTDSSGTDGEDNSDTDSSDTIL